MLHDLINVRQSGAEIGKTRSRNHGQQWCATGDRAREFAAQAAASCILPAKFADRGEIDPAGKRSGNEKRARESRFLALSERQSYAYVFNLDHTAQGGIRRSDTRIRSSLEGKSGTQIGARRSRRPV